MDNPSLRLCGFRDADTPAPYKTGSQKPYNMLNYSRLTLILRPPATPSCTTPIRPKKIVRQINS